MRNKIVNIILALVLIALPGVVSAQFVPVPITGFNHDVVAETGTSSLTTTTIAMDAVPASNQVMYSVAFRTANAFGGGGLPDNGQITSGADLYQLASYSSNNALLLQRTQNGDLTLTTPAVLSVIRILCLSTEGTSLVNVKLFFTDGTNTTALTNYSLGDWFNGATNLVLSGFGRCNRATPAAGANSYPTNPRFYYIEVPLTCTDRVKTLQKVNVMNVTTGGANAPYPNSVFFAISGKAFTPTNVTSVITNATCTTLGSATLTITGSATPFTVSWSTIPVQSGVTATNLTAGTYTATITDANSCVSTYPVTIGLTNNLTMSTRADTTICGGASFTPNLVSNATIYSWSPTTGVSNPAILNPLLSPTTTTLYTLTGTLGTCTISRSFTVNVTNLTMTNRADTSICNGASFTPNITSNAANYSWSPTTGVSNPAIISPVLSPTGTTMYTLTGTTGACSISRSFTVTVTNLSISSREDSTICLGASFATNLTSTATNFSWSPATGVSNPAILNPVLSPVTTTTYTVTGTTGACTVSRSFKVTVLSAVTVSAGPDLTVFGGSSVQLQGSGSAGTYLWTPATGLSATNILNPIAKPAITTTYTLRITTTGGCTNSDDVLVTVIPYCVKPLNAFTPNGDGINDKWLVTNGNCTKNIRVIVFNRYGNKVYESEDYKNDWNGTYKGKPLPDATYYFTIRFILINNDEVNLNGDVTILR